MPDIIRGLRERKNETKSPNLFDPVDELPVNPHSFQLMQPQKSSINEKLMRLKEVGKFIVIKLFFVAKHLWPALKFVGHLVAKFFHRVPRIRPNLAVFNRDEKDAVNEIDYKNIDEITQPVATTADIKTVKRHPLRYPEPMLDETLVSSQPKNTKVKEVPKKVTRKSIETQVDNVVEDAKEEQFKIESEKVSEEVVVEKPAFSVEKTKETRTRNRRRIVGKLAPKPTPLQEIEKTIMEEEPEKKETFSVREVEESVASEVAEPIEEKKMSFIDREAYALTDATQEISNQILEGKYNVAESALIDILSKNPRNTEAYRLLGIVYLKRKDFEQAREVFEEALRRDPEHGGLHGPLGYCYMSVGEYGKALSMYQQAHNMDETNVEYLEQLLIISSRMDRRPLVNMTAKKILALNPNHAEAKKFLARVAVR